MSGILGPDGQPTEPEGEGYNRNELKSLRPDLRQANLICCKCRKQPDLWAHYALHFGGSGTGNTASVRASVLSGAGVIHGQAQCHGDKEEIVIPFEVANQYITSGEKVPVFDNVNQFEPKRIVIPEGERLRLKGFDA